MKKCWFWQHWWVRRADLEDQFNDSRRFWFKLYQCKKCNHWKSIPPRDVL